MAYGILKSAVGRRNGSDHISATNFPEPPGTSESEPSIHLLSIANAALGWSMGTI